MRGGRILKKFLIVFLLLFCLSCSKKDNIYSFIDDLGNKVNVSSVNRVSALTGSFAGVAKLAEMNLVSVTSDAYTERDLDLGYDVIDLGSLKNPSLERIIASDPDFVILSSQIGVHRNIASSLSEMDIAVAFFETETFSGYLNMLQILTDLTGKKENYQKYGLEVLEKIEVITNKADTNPTILLIRAFQTNAYAKDSNNLVGAMLKDLGCINIADNNNSFLENLSMEYIISSDPEYIFVTTMGNDDEALEFLAAGIMKHEAWKDLRAVKAGQFFVLEKRLFHYKPNELWGEAYEKLFEYLHK